MTTKLTRHARPDGLRRARGNWQMRFWLLYLCALSGLATGTVLVAPASHAADGSWNVNASSDWSDGTAWLDNIADGAGSTANFTFNISPAITVTLNSSRSIGNINIGDSTSGFAGYTIANSNDSVLTLDNGGAGASIIKGISTVSNTVTDAFNLPITLADNLTLANRSNGNNANSSVRLNGPITESGGSRSITALARIDGGAGGNGLASGRGKVYLTGNNTFSGGVTVGSEALIDGFEVGGHLWLGTGVSLDPGVNPLGTGTLTLNRGAVNFAIAAGVVNSFNNNIVFGASANSDTAFIQAGAGNAAGAGDATLSGTISGPGGFSHVRFGTIHFTNPSNTYTGETYLDTGTLSVVTLADAGSNSSLGAPTGINARIRFGAGGGLKYLGTGSVTNRELNLERLGATVPDGALSVIDHSGTGLLKFTGDVTAGGISRTRTLVLTGSTEGVGEIAGVIHDYSDLDGPKSTLVTKNGTGTWVLSGANVHTGTTAVNEGTLLVNGAHTGGDVYTVAAGATLGGTGTISAAANVSGTLSPGAAGSVGTLTVGGLSLTGGLLDYQLNASNHTAGMGFNDLTVVSGALDLLGGATLNVTGIGGTLTAGDYDLIRFTGSLTGAATDIALGTIPLSSGLSASILIDSDSVNLRITAAGLMGDYNGDGKVNAADYVLWRKNPDSFGGTPMGYNTWRANFGNPPGSGSGLESDPNQVPEPTAAVLATLGVLMIGRLFAARSLRKFHPVATHR